MGIVEAAATEPDRVRDLLESVAAGRVSVQEAEARLAHLPFEDLGFARVDHHRAVRGAGPEVVHARSKTPEQAAAIATALLRREGAPVLVTKAGEDHARAVLAEHPEAHWHPRSGMLVLRRADPRPGRVVVLCAGTGDLPAAEEASFTVDAFGCHVDLVVDVGGGGIHRFFSQAEPFQKAAVLIVVAGMDSVLSALAAGLFGGPVIAVPTSVGYGAAFQGVAALLGMLNSCALGVSVVNIDNGFGAGVIAARILSAAHAAQQDYREPSVSPGARTVEPGSKPPQYPCANKANVSGGGRPSQRG
jgi:pyridinium-3,5-biscarboxylic acid mononucleotide synthase